MIGYKYSLVDAASPLLADIAALGPRKAAEVIAPAVLELFRNRFFQLDAERRNKLGGKPQHFYGQAARATHTDAQDYGVLLSVNLVGIRQRIDGGDIRPTGGRRYLSIPAITEAYGTVPADWGSAPKSGGKQDERTGRLHFVPTSRGGALVMNELSQVSFGKRVKKDGTRSVIRGEAMGGQVVFWLVPFVHQKPDNTILPTPEQVSMAGSRALSAFLGLMAKRAAASSPSLN